MLEDFLKVTVVSDHQQVYPMNPGFFRMKPVFIKMRNPVTE